MQKYSLDIRQNNIELLRELFPSIFSEGKIDLEKFKAAFCDDIYFHNERYTLNWAGKADAFKILQERTSATLTPQPELSVSFETAENVFIEGENLEVLKVLQKSYYNKIKCIIIDPPYNTGNDSFIYPDSFKENLEDYEKRVGEKNEEGYLMKEGLFRKNSRENGHYHSNWLSMMLPRLFLARNLLRDDGVIFVHIDDNEVHNLRLLMNEIFGEENFVDCITWNTRVPKNDNKGLGNIHQYILVYVKYSHFNRQFFMAKDGLDEVFEFLDKMKRQQTPIADAEDELKKFYDKKGFDRGITLYNSLDENYEPWGKINMSWPNSDTFGPFYDILHPITKKPTKKPDRGWRWKRETFDSQFDYSSIIQRHDGSIICGNIWFAKDENTQPSSITYLRNVSKMLLRTIVSLKSDGGVELEEIFEGKSYFSNPKPISLLKLLFNSILEKDGLFLDFFAGSGTTAQAVFELNREDSGSRKFILVQLPELCDEKSEAYRAGYKTISDISRERVRRVIQKIDKENKEKLFNNTLDLGFKSFKLSPSNFKVWCGEEITEENIELKMEFFIDPVKPESQAENMLIELMLKSGYQLTDKVRNQGNYYSINNNELIIVLTDMNLDIAAEIISLQPTPQKVIALDKLFAGNDELKTNTALQMKDAGVEFKTI